MAGPLFPAASSLLTHYAPQRYLNWYMRLGGLFSLVFFFCFTFFWLLRSVFSLCFFSSGLLGPAVISLVLRCSSEPLAPALTLAALAGLGAVSCLSHEAKSIKKPGLLLLLGLPAPEMAPSSAATRWPFALLRERPAMCLAALGFAEGWCTNAWVAFVLPILTRTWAMPEHFKDCFPGRCSLIFSIRCQDSWPGPVSTGAVTEWSGASGGEPGVCSRSQSLWQAGVRRGQRQSSVAQDEGNSVELRPCPPC